MEDLCDTIRLGMKSVMKEAEGEKDKIDDLRVREERRDVAATEATNLWRLTKHITTGESKKVAGTVDLRQGWAAWRKSCQSTQPNVIANRGIVLAQISEVKPATNHTELREKVTEIEMVLMQAIHVGEESTDTWKEASLRRVLDPMTKQDQADDSDASRKRR